MTNKLAVLSIDANCSHAVEINPWDGDSVLFLLPYENSLNV